MSEITPEPQENVVPVEAPAESTEPAKRKPGRPKGAKSGNHLTPTKKAEVVALWKTGDYTLDQLSKKYGRSKEALSRIFAKAGAEKGSYAKEVGEEATKAVEKKLLEESAVLADMIRIAKTDANKLFETLRKLMIETIVKNRAAGKPMAAILGDIKVIDLAARAARNIQAGQFEVLGINKEDKNKKEELSELKISGLSTHDIESLKQAEKAPDDFEQELKKLEESLGDEELLAEDDNDDDDDSDD